MQNYWNTDKAHVFNTTSPTESFVGVKNGVSTGIHPLAPQAWENVQLYFESDKKDKYKYHLTHNCVSNWY